MLVHFPGKLEVRASANYLIKLLVDGEWQTQDKPLRLEVEIRTPDGRPFTKEEVTLEDLRRFRDLRGISQGTWTYHVRGESAPLAVDEGDARMVAGDAHVRIRLHETVGSASAPPLLQTSIGTNEHRR